jgi:hypothetical protein
MNILWACCAKRLCQNIHVRLRIAYTRVVHIASTCRQRCCLHAPPTPVRPDKPGNTSPRRLEPPVDADLGSTIIRGVPLGGALCAAWTVRGFGLDDPRPRRRSDAFPASHRTVRAQGWTVRDGAGLSSSSSLEPRSRPLEEEILGRPGSVGHSGCPQTTWSRLGIKRSIRGRGLGWTTRSCPWEGKILGSLWGRQATQDGCRRRRVE